MKISKTHQKFSDYLEDPKALTNPEDYLGPNWEDVINFWLYVDTLSASEKRKMGDRYWDLDYHVLKYASDASWVAAKEVVGMNVKSAAWMAAYYVTSDVFADATNELIAPHKLLEQDKTLLFLPLCLKP
jgi:hypothetical protein